MRPLALALVMASAAFAQQPAAEECDCTPPAAVTGNVGTCRWCGGESPSGMIGCCDRCMRRLDVCKYCGKRQKGFAGRKWMSGVAAPRDLRKRRGANVPWTFAVEGGGELEMVLSDSLLTAQPAEHHARVAFRAYRDEALGCWILWECYDVLPAANDRTDEGDSDAPVHWRLGGIRGPEVAPDKGRYKVTSPVCPTFPVTIESGDTALRWMPPELPIVFGKAAHAEDGALRVDAIVDDAGTEIPVRMLKYTLVNSGISEANRKSGRFLFQLLPKRGDAPQEVWDAHGVGPPDAEKEIEGTSDGPVRWRLGDLYGIYGPEVLRKDKAYKLRLPNTADPVVQILDGDQVVRRFNRERGTWVEVPPK